MGCSNSRDSEFINTEEKGSNDGRIICKYRNRELIEQVEEVGVDVIHYMLSHLLIKDITNVSLSCNIMNEIIKITKPICANEKVLLHEYNNKHYTITYFDQYIHQHKRRKNGQTQYDFSLDDFRFKNAQILEIGNLKDGALISFIINYFKKLKQITIHHNNSNKYRNKNYGSIVRRISRKRNLVHLSAVNLQFELEDLKTLITNNMYTLTYLTTKNFSINLKSNKAVNKHALREYVSMVNSDKDYEYGYKAYNTRKQYINMQNEFAHLEKRFWVLSFSFVDKNYYVTEHNNMQRRLNDFFEKQGKVQMEWSCHVCTFLNNTQSKRCTMCQQGIRPRNYDYNDREEKKEPMQLQRDHRTNYTLKENQELKKALKTQEKKIIALKLRIKQLEKANIETNKYLEWNDEDVVLWIISIENNRFAKYENVLRSSLKEEEVTGQDLKHVNENDIHRWGIKKFSDTKVLKNKIEELIKPKLIEGYPPKAYM